MDNKWLAAITLLISLSSCSWFQTEVQPKIRATVECMRQCVEDLHNECQVNKVKQCLTLCAVISGMNLICPPVKKTNGAVCPVGPMGADGGVRHE